MSATVTAVHGALKMGRKRKKNKFIFQNISTFWNIFAHCAYVASTEWSTVWKLHTLVVSFRLSCPTFYFKFIKLCTLCQLKILLHLLSFWFVSFFKKKKKYISFIHPEFVVCLFWKRKKITYHIYIRSCWKKITTCIRSISDLWTMLLSAHLERK